MKTVKYEKTVKSIKTMNSVKTVNRAKRALRSLLQEQAGEGLFTSLYVILILAVIMFAAVEVASYSMSAWKLYGAMGEIMEIMKSENGLDSAGERRFRELTVSLKLDDLGLSVSGTPKTAQRGDLLELRVTGRYKVRCLKPFGKELVAPINMKLNGLAHAYIRKT